MLSSLFYFLYFAAFGIYIPYWTLYLKHLSLSPVQIATIYAIPSIARIFLPPIYGYLADRGQHRKMILRMTAVAQVAPLLLLIQFHSYPALLLLISIFSLFNAAVLPFTEATVQEEQEKGKLDYGRTRLWGTVSFILLAATFGKVIERFHYDWILYGFIAFLFLLSVLSFFQPGGKIGVQFQRQDIDRILRKKSTWIFLTCVFFMHLSQGAYYGFFSIHLSEIGFQDSNIGIQWAAAAASEIAIFFFASVILRRFALVHLFRICLLFAAVRWLWIYYAEAYFWLTLSQGMHAFSFGLFHIACMRMTHTIFSEGFRSIGQSLVSSLGWGLGSVIGVLVSGYLWQEFGAATFLFSSAIAFAGFLFAYLLKTTKEEETMAGVAVDLPPFSPDR
jgi:MFS transporter, PPP family, 3-phenylpropionic acid transporter